MSLRVLHGSAVRPCLGFSSCGDASATASAGGSMLYVLLDALGHGPDAERSAREACAALQTLGAASLQEAFAVVDRALAGMREVVMAGVEVRDGQARFAGVGNIEVLGPAQLARPVSQVGRVGRGLRPVREAPLSAELGARWVLASDGLRARELRAAYEATRLLPPAEAAGRLIELAGRDDDDASALVLDFGESQ